MDLFNAKSCYRFSSGFLIKTRYLTRVELFQYRVVQVALFVSDSAEIFGVCRVGVEVHKKIVGFGWCPRVGRGGTQTSQNCDPS